MGFWLNFVAGLVASWLSVNSVKSKRIEGGLELNKDSNIEQIPVVYGQRKVNGTRVYLSTGGSNNAYLYIALALCEGEVEEIGDIFIDDVPLTDSRFNNLVTINKYTGTDTQTADQMLISGSGGEWTSNHRLQGVAYLAIRLKWDADAFSSKPNIHAVVKGRKVYDPRTGTTAYTENPALHLRDYLTNTRFGKGLSSNFLDDTLFQTAANECEENVVPYNGESAVDRFSSNVILKTSEPLIENVNTLLSGMRGHMPYQNGKYGLIVEGGGTSSFSFDESNIIGGLSIQSETKKNKLNKVIVEYVNPEANWQVDETQYPSSGSQEEQDFLSEDGVVLEKRLTLETVTDKYLADDIAELIVNKSRNSLGVKITATSEALNCSIGQIVDLTHSSPAWSAKPFRINAISLRPDGNVELELIEHQNSIYPWLAKTAPDAVPDTNLPNPYNVAPVTNLVSTPSVITGTDGTFTSVIDTTWTASDDGFVSEYLVTVTPSVGLAQTFKTSTTSNRYYVADFTVTYTVSVRAIGAIGSHSSPVTTSPATPIGDTVAPSIPNNVSITGSFQKFILKWDNPSDLDFSHNEIKRSLTSNEVDAAAVGQTKADTWTDQPHTSAQTRWFWVRSVDVSGNASSWVSFGSATTAKLVVDDFDDGVIDIDFIDAGFQNALDSKAESVDLDTEVARITSIVNEQQIIGDTVDTVAERMLTLATTQSDTLGKISDAGITVDPSTGSVTIQAVETLRLQTESSINSVKIDLDAAEADISLKASVAYVNNEIASAVLDSADLASLNSLEARVTQSELDIDGAEASISLKADITTVNALDVRLDQAEIDIDGAEAAILLKASSADLGLVENRVTTAETTLGALDVASIVQTVADTRTINNKLDASSITNLKQLLDAHNQREATNTELAYARQEILADVRDNETALSSAKLELAALIDDNKALILSEQTARTTADEAITSSVASLTATVGDNTSAITSEQIARSNSDTALSSSVTALTATVNSNTAAIVNEQTVRASEDSALSSSITTLGNTVNGHSTTLTQHAEVVNGVNAQYTVTIDQNGHLSGFGLVSDIIDGNPTSAFIVSADQFAIGSAGNYPFVYYANDTTVNKGGVDYTITAGTYIKDANIQAGSIDSAQIKDAVINSAHIDTLDASDISTGTLSADRINAGSITSDKITIDDNISFGNSSSGLIFDKTSLGSTATGAFYGRSQNQNGDDIVGFHISSATSSMYADSDGNFSLSNVRIFAGNAGASTHFDGAGDYTVNLSSLTTSLAIELIGGGSGSPNNPAGDRPSGWRRAGAAGSASWIEFYNDVDGTGTMLGSRITAAGASSTAWDVGSNAVDANGYNGANSSQPNSGGAGGQYVNWDQYPPALAQVPAKGVRGGGGGGAGNKGRIRSLTAFVDTHANHGASVSQIISVPTGAKSMKIHLGAGGAGGGKDTYHSDFNGFYQLNGENVAWVYYDDGDYYVMTGQDGGDGYFEFSDPNAGGIEVDLVDLLNRVIALENHH